jgi:hypothetical protein
MMEKLPSLVRLGGARPPPFTIYTSRTKFVVYAPAEGMYINPISTLPLYVLCGPLHVHFLHSLALGGGGGGGGKKNFLILIF